MNWNRKHRILAGAILFVLALSSVPSIAGFLGAPPGGTWTGILTRNTADVNGYLSIIEEIRQGHCRARNLFTAEPHPPFQIRPYYTFLGLIGRIVSSLSNVVLLEAGRIFSATILLVILAFLATRLFPAKRERLIAFFILSLGSGFGWLGLVQIPLDLGLVETSTFLTLISPPLYSVSLSLVLGILLCMDAAWNSPTHAQALRYSILSMILGMWLALDRPFSLATLGFAVGGSLLLQMAKLKKVPASHLLRTIPLLLGVCLALGYQTYVLSETVVYAEWNRQHILPTPEMTRLLASLGLLVPGALLGVRVFFHTNPTLATLAGFYILASLVLSHSPIPQQVRFLEGLPVSLALFTCFGVIRILRRIKKLPLQTMCAGCILAVLTASSFAVIIRDLEAIAKQSPPQYIPELAIDAMRKLVTLSSPVEVILSTESSGNFLVAYSGRPVALGHRIATAHYQQKLELVTDFFHTKGSDPRAYALFRRSRATWLFWGPEEAWLAKGLFHPKDATFLQARYSNGFITLYRLSSR